MQIISHKQARMTGLAILLAAGFFMLPVATGQVQRLGYASAWAGEQGGDHGGGLKDLVPGNNGYTSYSAPDPSPSTLTSVPCESCKFTGSGFDPRYAPKCHAQWCGGE
jgi:hypothetical protein